MSSDLSRFVEAQDTTYETAIAEIRRGAKRTHWMWFIFPQLEGLGSSPMALRFAIKSVEQARTYLEHPLLGHRYVECVSALQDLAGVTAEQVFGTTDALKLRSSLTLFAQARDQPLFQAALLRWFGSPDQRTMDLLSASSAGAEQGDP